MHLWDGRLIDLDEVGPQFHGIDFSINENRQFLLGLFGHVAIDTIVRNNGSDTLFLRTLLGLMALLTTLGE